MFVTNIPGLDLKLSIVVHIGCGRCLLENLMLFLGQATPRPIGQKTISAGFERLDISCVLKLHSHLKISFFMMSSYNYLIYSLFQAFKIRPRTPSDPREVYITLLQQIPEIAHIFSVGITKQSECYLDQFLIFKVRKK